MAAAHELCISSSAEQRLEHARAYLRRVPMRAPLLLLAADTSAATLLIAGALSPGEARFDWRKRTLDALALELALPELARAAMVPLRALALEALVTRVVHELSEQGSLGCYGGVAERPGFVRALARSISDLRLACVASERVAPHAPELARVLAAYEAALVRSALADRRAIYDAAAAALARDGASVARELVALDLPLVHACEVQLAAVLVQRASGVLITVARGDERSEAHWRECLDGDARVVRREPDPVSDLARLQSRLFSAGLARDERAAERGRVTIVSSPGEAREAVEVARGISALAARGVPFDRIAIVLRAVEGYRAVVEEALARADIPAHFAEGVRRPRPEGRAFLALLACARDGLTASAFAEYLSLGVMARVEGEAELVSPRKWERLLVDAAVIGGRGRWQRRLRGLARELADERTRLEGDDPRITELTREEQRVESLERFALPLIDQLSALPSSGTWGELLPQLEALARASLREPDAVLNVLAELLPLSPIGGVTLRVAYRVLASRLTTVVLPSTGHGAGKVFVGAIEEVRGRAFDHVFVTGLAERVFPPRIGEDPLLPDRVRQALGPELWLTDERVARERLLLRIAVGAAREGLTVSFPRFDLVHGRPRVPSFYGLELLQAIDGTLPAFDELTRRADPGAAARMGFPAPEQAADAIDDAEYDLAMLAKLMRAPEAERRGAARYLLEANVHLARSLRFRARRWELPRFSPADGLVTSDAGRELLARYRLGTRAYSATSLAQFAACPYRFFLHAIMGVAAREEAASVDELDARQRGVLFHRVLRATLAELATRGELPLTREHLASARELLDRLFAEHAARARDDYAPSIDGVFEAGLRVLARDLHEWLERLCDEARFVPAHFELGFGLRRGELDPASRQEPVALAAGVRLHGAIDLVERSLSTGGAMVLRATDYKTGSAGTTRGIVDGGRTLQPILYALALEQLFPDAKVEGGRLYFCTERGEFKSHEVLLDAAARSVAGELVASIDALVEQGFLPAEPARLPDERDRFECERCAYRPVCGPYEPERVGAVKGKDYARLAPLSRVRNLP